MPTFSLVYCPLLLSVQLLPIYNAPLPLLEARSQMREAGVPNVYLLGPFFLVLQSKTHLLSRFSPLTSRLQQAIASETSLSPGNLRRRATRLVSSYALFK